MSDSRRSVASSRLTPRAVRIRNRCVAVLAQRRVSRVAAGAAAVAATIVVLGTAYLTRDVWLPRADAEPAAPAWIPLTDSVTAELDSKLMAVASSEVSVAFAL